MISSYLTLWGPIGMSYRRYRPGWPARMRPADRLFAELFSRPRRVPPMDVTEREDGYRVQAALPGFKPEELEVTVSGRTLTIRASRAQEESQDEAGHPRREIACEDVSRSLSVPTEVRVEDARASYENGVLTVDLPLADRARPVKVPVAVQPAHEAGEQERAPEPNRS
jgi:HSP20 family protein